MSVTLPAPDAPPRIVWMDDGVPVLSLPDTLAYDELREWLKLHLPEHLDTIGGRASRLDLGRREIRLFDLRRILSFLRSEHDLEITGLYAREAQILRYAERELKLKLFPTTDAPEPSAADLAAELAEGAPPLTEDLREVEDEDDVGDDVDPDLEEPAVAERVDAPDEEPEADDGGGPEPQLMDGGPVASVQPGRRTLTLHRTLRSGASIRFEGDITLFGDVNPGAQVVAAGNIIVLGALKGLAHAGATGAEDAFILGFDLSPTQLRIGRKIAIPPERKPGRTGIEPEIARVEDGQIVIAPYRGGASR